LQLKLKEKIALKPEQVGFRYNPALISVNMTLPNLNGGVASSIVPALQKWYQGDTDSVSWLINRANLTKI
jgi:hypothetical protein